MTMVERYPYVARDPQLVAASLAPLLPIVLHGTSAVSTLALLDTGAAVNVLPYSVGEQLGADWNLLPTRLHLTGSLTNVDAKVLVVPTTVGAFSITRLVFAWAKSEIPSVILGQTNFFMEFDACFFRTLREFEIRKPPRS